MVSSPPCLRKLDSSKLALILLLVLVVFLLWSIWGRDLSGRVPLDSVCPVGQEEPKWDALYTGGKDYELVIVTACSKTVFERLRNLVGSIHFWEPGLKVIVFDLGLSSEQLVEVSSWRNVELRRFQFEKYPPHVRISSNYAWKVLLIAETAQEFPAFLYLDSGMEIRQDLTVVKNYMSRHGFITGHQGGSTLLEKTLFETIARLTKLNPELFAEEAKLRLDNASFCSAMVQGYLRDSTAARVLIPTMYRCAIDPDCMAPIGAGRDNHNFDQSILSILVILLDLPIFKDPRLVMGDLSIVPLTETDRSDLLMVARRWQYPKPYLHCVVHDPTTASSPKYSPQDGLFLETSAFYRVGSDSPLLKCLRNSNYSWTPCQDLISEAMNPSFQSEVYTYISIGSSFTWDIVRRICHCAILRGCLFAFIMVELALLWMSIPKRRKSKKVRFS